MDKKLVQEIAGVGRVQRVGTTKRQRETIASDCRAKRAAIREPVSPGTPSGTRRE